MINQFCQRQISLHCIVCFVFRYDGHQLRTRHTQIFFKRNKMVSFTLKCIQYAWQCSECRLPSRTSCIVQQNDMPVTAMHSVNHSLIDLVGSNANFPVVWVDRFSHKDIVSATCQYHWLNFFTLSRVAIRIIWRTKQHSALARYTLNEHASEFQFGISAAF